MAGREEQARRLRPGPISGSLSSSKDGSPVQVRSRGPAGREESEPRRAEHAAKGSARRSRSSRCHTAATSRSKNLPVRRGCTLPGNRFLRPAARTFDIAQLDDIPPDKSVIAICNHQMALARADRHARREPRRRSAGGVHDATGGGRVPSASTT